jgi:hypothetical protein
MKEAAEVAGRRGKGHRALSTCMLFVHGCR